MQKWKKNNQNKNIDSIMLRSGKTKVGKEEFYCIKNIMKFWDIDVNNIVILNLIETKTNSKAFGWIFRCYETIRFRCAKTFKEKNNKLMCFCIDNKLLEKYKTIQTNIGDFKNIQLNFLPVYDNRYIKTKRRTYGDNVYTNFRRFMCQKFV